MTHARPEKQLRLIWYCWEHRACSDMHRHCWCLSASFKLHKVFFNASPSRGAMYLLKCILPLVDQKSNPSSFIWDADCHCLPKKISLSKMFIFFIIPKCSFLDVFKQRMVLCMWVVSQEYLFANYNSDETLIKICEIFFGYIFDNFLWNCRGATHYFAEVDLRYDQKYWLSKWICQRPCWKRKFNFITTRRWLWCYSLWNPYTT